MARIVTAAGTSRGPQLKTPASQWELRGRAGRRATALAYRGAAFSGEPAGGRP